MAVGTDQAISNPRVLLSGASSQIGVFAIPRLLAAGFRVIAVSRKGRPRGYPDFEQVKWLNEADAGEACADCQYQLSTGPMDLAQKFLATEPNPVSPDHPVTPDLIRGPFSKPQQKRNQPDSSKQFQTAVIFSSSSVQSKQQSANQAERSQIQAMLKLESKLKRMAEDKNIKLVIFRPTLVYGCGLDTNISRLAAWIRRFGFMPINGKATGLRQPVHADDLAAVAVTALLSKKDLPPVLPVSGGETLSYADMVARVFVAMGKPVKLISLPQWLFVFLLNLANIFSFGGSVNSEMVRRQQADLVFDDSQARQLLDYKPRPFKPQVEDFSMPVHFQGNDHL